MLDLFAAAALVLRSFVVNGCAAGHPEVQQYSLITDDPVPWHASIWERKEVRKIKFVKELPRMFCLACAKPNRPVSCVKYEVLPWTLV